MAGVFLNRKPQLETDMTKLVLHLFHDDAASLSTAPALAERMHQAPDGSATALELYIFGPAEGVLATPD